MSSPKKVVTVFAKMASNACGRRCQFPLDMASDTCQEDCAWDEGHTFERCACVTHINNHRAPPIRKTVDSETFPRVLEAAASRGLQSGHALMYGIQAIAAAPASGQLPVATVSATSRT